MKTTALVGTMVPDSRVELVTRRVLDGLHGEKTILTGRDVNFGNFDPTLEQQPESVQMIRAAVEDSEVVLLATPAYNDSFSGSLKNMIDALERNQLDEKTVGIIVVSGGKFPKLPAEHLTTVARSLSGDVCTRELLIPEAHSQLTTDDTVTWSKEIQDQISEFQSSLR